MPNTEFVTPLPEETPILINGLLHSLFLGPDSEQKFAKLLRSHFDLISNLEPLSIARSWIYEYRASQSRNQFEGLEGAVLSIIIDDVLLYNENRPSDSKISLSKKRIRWIKDNVFFLTDYSKMTPDIYDWFETQRITPELLGILVDEVRYFHLSDLNEDIIRTAKTRVRVARIIDLFLGFYINKIKANEIIIDPDYYGKLIQAHELIKDFRRTFYE